MFWTAVAFATLIVWGMLRVLGGERERQMQEAKVRAFLTQAAAAKASEAQAAAVETLAKEPPPEPAARPAPAAKPTRTAEVKPPPKRKAA